MTCRSCVKGLVLMAALCLAAPAAAQDALAMAACFFTSSAPSDWGDNQAQPAFATLESVPCKGVAALYVACRPQSGDWMQYKEADRFKLELLMPGEARLQSFEITAPQVWMKKDAPVTATLWKPAEQGLAGDFGVTPDQTARLCPEVAPNPEDNEPPPAIRVSMAWGRVTENPPPTEDGAPAEPVVAYQHFGNASLPVISTEAPPPKKIYPPSLDEVLDTVRNEWPGRYPTYTFIDGFVAENTAEHDPANRTFSYSMSVTLQDPDGQEVQCELGHVVVQKLETGGVILQELPLDLAAQCN